MEWPDDSNPPVPFACYLLDYGRPVTAGDAQIAVRNKWMVELYEKRRDAQLEAAIADELRASFGSVRRDENWIENDNLLQVVYTFYELEGDLNV
jgi:hypothetical protein